MTSQHVLFSPEMAVFLSSMLDQSVLAHSIICVFVHVVGIPHEFVKSHLQHDSMLNDERIPNILQRLVEEVYKSGEPLYNPKHPRL